MMLNTLVNHPDNDLVRNELTVVHKFLGFETQWCSTGNFFPQQVAG